MDERRTSYDARLSRIEAQIEEIHRIIDYWLNKIKGVLTKARLYEKIFLERIIGIFAKKEFHLYLNNILVDNRH